MSEEQEALPPLPSEAVLLDVLDDLEDARGGLKFTRTVVVSQGRAQSAATLVAKHAGAHVTAWYMDLYLADLARAACERTGHVPAIVCSADLPEEEVDLAIFAVSTRSEAELTRDLLQQAHARLIEGGELIAAVDNPRDQWLREQLAAMFDKVTCRDAADGRSYLCRKTKPLKKLKNFEAEVVFRDEENLIKLVTRPGVFSHRHLDPGARQLMLTMDIEADSTVLDLGCGSGAVGIAAALRAGNVQVHAVDCNARAIDCTRRGAELNDVTTLQTHLNHDGVLGLGGSVDVVLANPPYYSDFSIAERMVETAREALRPGGAMLFVTKHPKWYEERLPETLEDVAIFESGKYWVACGRKPD